jgi:hypothetical protein
VLTLWSTSLYSQRQPFHGQHGHHIVELDFLGHVLCDIKQISHSYLYSRQMQYADESESDNSWFKMEAVTGLAFKGST